MYSHLSFLRKRPGVITLVFIATIFSLGLAAFLFATTIQVNSDLEKQLALEVEAVDQLDRRVAQTIEMLNTHGSIKPCSLTFRKWMRKIAFLPDGIHEIIYSDDTRSCSVAGSIMTHALTQDEPDILRPDLGYSFWLDRDLGALGFPGLKGTFLRSGNFTLILPPIAPLPAVKPWQNREYVSQIKGDRWFHRAGVKGLHSNYRAVGLQNQIGYSFSRSAFWGMRCDKANLTCVFIEAPVDHLIATYKLTILGSLFLLFISSIVLAELAAGLFARHWSFRARFVRTFGEGSLVCHYQPILSLDDEQIDGVEVLVRWRDLDGALVYPDKFLPIVEKRNLTRQLTEIVVRKATKDLENIPFCVDRPRVNINVFPKDFSACWLAEILAPMLASKQNFQPVVEIIESSDLPVNETRESIALLRAHGIETFIDDFGVGYSSIHYLSSLGADGVKLDRFFAMAPEGSLSTTMMYSAIEMIGKTGQKLVVEGVENKARLMELRATNQVDMVQGYLISPPLPIDKLSMRLAEFSLEQLKASAYVPMAHKEIVSAFG